MKVVNVKTEKADIMIDRSSILGNPFHIGKDGTREQVIKKYRDYIWNCIQVVDELNRIGEIEDINNLSDEYSETSKFPELKLGCHCKPEPCHGDIVIKAIKYLRNRKGE